MITAAIILLLVFFNALFVASEFAIVAVSKPSIKHLAEEGNRRARTILDIINSPVLQDRYIATAQVGITAASLGLGMYGEEVIAERLISLFHHAGLPEQIFSHGVAGVLSVGALTYLHVVLGEMVPKSLALCFTERAMFWLVMPMLFWMKLFSPVIWLLNGISTFVLGLFGVERRASTASLHSQEELELIIDESEAEGMLRSETGDVIQHLFEFGEIIASEVMIPRVHVAALAVSDTAEQMSATISGAYHTYYPVYEKDKDHIVGVVHIKEVVRSVTGERAGALPVEPVPFVPCTASLQTVLDTIHETRAHLLVVLDEFGGTAGIITVKDIFEEVLGDFGMWEKLGAISKDVALRVPGTARLDEVGEKLNISLEHEDVTTVGGLVLAITNRPAQKGDVVKFQNVQVEVTQVLGKGVKECIVKKVDDELGAMDK